MFTAGTDARPFPGMAASEPVPHEDLLMLSRSMGLAMLAAAVCASGGGYYALTQVAGPWAGPLLNTRGLVFAVSFGGAVVCGLTVWLLAILWFKLLFRDDLPRARMQWRQWPVGAGASWPRSPPPIWCPSS